jgi:DNA primase
MCLSVLGYEAVAPQSENTRTQFDLLKELIPKYEKIIILYDNDEAGMLGAKTLEEFLNEDKVKSVFIKDPNTKDISDYIQTYGVNCGQLLIKMLIDE